MSASVQHGFVSRAIPLYDEVSQNLKDIPEIVSAHYTTGNYSIFVKIICKDTNHLREVLHGKIQKISGIQRTETFISLEESINDKKRLMHTIFNEL